jgi:hypothetical protein
LLPNISPPEKVEPLPYSVVLIFPQWKSYQYPLNYGHQVIKSLL